MINKKKIRIGIIGLGKMGLNHLNILESLNKVEIIFTHDLDKNKHANRKFNFIKSLSEISTNLVDAVIIATPTSTHFDIIKKIGKNIKNVFVEKPLAQNFNETKKIINFAIKNKINLKVGFIERFNPAIASLLSILKKNEKKVSIDFTRASPISDRIKDVDVITDLMVHDIDLAIFLNGKVKTIKSFGHKKNNMIAHANVVLIHYSGVITNLLASRITQKKIRTINITLEKKYIACDLLKKEVNMYTNTMIKNLNNNFNYKSISETIETGHKEPLLLEILAFIDNCHGINNKYLADYSDSYEIMNICEKIKKEINFSNEK
jgi:predicted dehydrogenase